MKTSNQSAQLANLYQFSDESLEAELLRYLKELDQLEHNQNQGCIHYDTQPASHSATSAHEGFTLHGGCCNEESRQQHHHIEELQTKIEKLRAKRNDNILAKINQINNLNDLDHYLAVYEKQQNSLDKQYEKLSHDYKKALGIVDVMDCCVDNHYFLEFIKEDYYSNPSQSKYFDKVLKLNDSALELDEILEALNFKRKELLKHHEPSNVHHRTIWKH